MRNMPRTSRKRRGASSNDDHDGDAVMADVENSPSAASFAAASSDSPDPTQPSPSKRPRTSRSHRGTSSSNKSKKKSKPPKLKVNIKRFHGVARWSWNVGGAASKAAVGEEEDDDVCGICQNPFEGVAPGMKYPGDDCPLERGPCNHCFHLQCVDRWLRTKKSCPICRAEWPT